MYACRILETRFLSIKSGSRSEKIFNESVAADHPVILYTAEILHIYEQDCGLKTSKDADWSNCFPLRACFRYYQLQLQSAVVIEHADPGADYNQQQQGN